MIILDDSIDSFKPFFFTSKILEWASINLRSFPWRHEKTFYAVLISEFFLQRTNVAQVLPIYNSFITKFPSFNQLMQANPLEYEIYFQKLGLYKRYEYLKEIIEILKDKNDFEHISKNELLDLPGIGQYTAHSILCFWYNKKVPLVDSNIIRIFSRFFNLNSPKKSPRMDKSLWIFAEQLLPATNYQEYNYALIDFGSEICVPHNPKCRACILKSECYYNNREKKECIIEDII